MVRFNLKRISDVEITETTQRRFCIAESTDNIAL
jgi:hypothetical protein